MSLSDKSFEKFLLRVASTRPKLRKYALEILGNGSVYDTLKKSSSPPEAPLEEEAKPKGKGRGVSDSSKAMWAEFFKDMKGKKVPNLNPNARKKEISISTLSGYASKDPKAKAELQKLLEQWQKKRQKAEEKEKYKLPADKQKEHEGLIKRDGGKESNISLAHKRDLGHPDLKGYDDEDITEMMALQKTKSGRGPNSVSELSKTVGRETRGRVKSFVGKLKDAKKKMESGDPNGALKDMDSSKTIRDNIRPFMEKHKSFKGHQMESASKQMRSKAKKMLSK